MHYLYSVSNNKTSLLERLTNLYLYSSLHIGIGAFALCYFHYRGLALDVDMNYVLFVSCSTICLYGIHRLVGIKKLSKEFDKGRFRIISQHFNHIVIYTFIAALLAAYIFIKFDIGRYILLSFGIIFSLLYVLPIFPKRRRLRDFHYVKIFLIAICWSFLCVFIPLYENQNNNLLSVVLSVHLILYFLAITLPFDIRDQKIDQKSKVKTLVSLLGPKGALNLSFILLAASSILLMLLFFYKMISFHYLVSFLSCHLVSTIFVKMSQGKKHDYYYSGLVDGTMIIPLLTFYLISYLS